MGDEAPGACKLIKSCGGTRCKGKEPNPRSDEWRRRFNRWSTAEVLPLPKRGWPGFDRRHRIATTCPGKAPRWMHQAVRLYFGSLGFTGPMFPGSYMEQPARMTEALGIVRAEHSVVEHIRREERQATKGR